MTAKIEIMSQTPTLASTSPMLEIVSSGRLHEVLYLVWGFANSNFGTALVTAASGAAAGGLAGAWAAQLIANRTERRKAQIAEIRATNAAINLTAGIVNSYISIKSQFVLPMVADLEQTGNRYRAWLEDAGSKRRDQVEPFEFRTEFRIFSPVQAPINHLREILFNKINADNFTLSIFHLIDQAIFNAQDSLAQRNSMVHEFRMAPPGATAQIVRLYLGMPRPDGPADERYPNLVRALQVQTDDVILFGKELAQHLAMLNRALAMKCGTGTPKAVGVDFTRSEKQGLIPDAAEYKDLLAALRSEGPGTSDEAAVRLG